MKKIFSAIISSPLKGRLCGLLFALLATTNLWAYDFQFGDLYYRITSSSASYTVEVTYLEYYSSENYSGLTTATIPDTVTYNGTTYSVTSIGYSAFRGCSSLTSVTIPNSVTSIGGSAFYDCSSLTSVTIGNSVTSIGGSAFYHCSSLTSVTIPNSVTSIGSSAFDGCSSLTSITIPNSVTSIGSSAFYGCSFLTAPVYNAHCFAYMPTSYSGVYTIPEGIKQIAGAAFKECSSLTSVTIPNSVTSIGSSAFRYCSSLTSITIPNSVTSIGESAFSYCSSLTSIIIPEGVTSIGSSAFYECSSLTSVTIGNSVTSIGSSAFRYCSSLTSITIPNSVTSIGDYAFKYCSSLTSITIPESVTSIGREAFDGTGIYENESNWENDVLYIDNCLIEAKTSISGAYTIKENTRLIACDAFYNCSSLTSVTIPNSVTSIGSYAFYGCSSLTSVTIPNSVTSIGSYAFENCSSLTSITIGNSVTNIERYAFYGCSSLKHVEWNVKNHTDFDYWNNRFFDNQSPIQSFIFGENVEYIPAYLCYNMDSLKTVTIPNSVTSIGREAFCYCSSLTSATIGNSVTSIERYAFYGCSSLKHVEWNVKNHTDFDYNNRPFYNQPSIQSFTFGEDVEYIPAYLCYDMDSLTSITIPNSVTSIGSRAFEDCSSLTSVTIGNSVTSIEESAFDGCSSLASVTIPNSVTSIEYSAFRDCPIDTVYSRNPIPPQLKSSYSAKPFNSQPVCYIPCGATSSYKNSSWKDYMSKFVEGNFYFLNTSVSDSLAGRIETIRELTCDEATFQAIPNVGYEFVQWSDGVTDALRTLDLTQDTTLIAEFRQLFDGKCGDNLYWKHYDDKIIIHGEGTMYDYAADSVPWYQFRDIVKTVEVFDGATSIGNNAFALCKNLNTLTLPGTIENIGENAFAGCTKLYDIYCFAMEPPTAYESSFVNYNAFLHVPCDNQRVYLLDILFGNFKYVECIEAETAPTDTVVVTPSFNDAEFIWPSNSSADSYTLAISKDGEVFCTLTFNANGQLTGIAFAPARNGQHNAPAAAQTANGFAFTVTGLDEGANYTYDLLIQDRSGNTLQSYSGEFRTQSTSDRTVTVEYDAAQGQVTGAGTYLVGDTVTLTAIPNDGYRFVRWSNEVEDNPYTFIISDNVTLSAEFEEVITTSVENTIPSQQSDTRKLLRDGQLLILRDGKTYTVMGAEVK